MFKLKKVLNRKNALLSTGLILLVLGAAIWVVNFSFVRIKSAEAESGDFNETWTAEEAFGVYAFSWTSGNIPYNTDGGDWFRDIALPKIQSGSVFYNAGVPEPDAAYSFGLDDGNTHYRLRRDAGDFVTKWYVTGNIKP